MTAYDLSMLRHLAKVTGRTIMERGDGWVDWNPLEHANDCRELIEKLDKPMEIEYDPSEKSNPWYVVIDREDENAAYGPTEERAKCLAAARMTGWQEPEESGQ